MIESGDIVKQNIITDGQINYCLLKRLRNLFFNSGGYNYPLHAGFGFSYRFHSGVGISLSGRYNIGALYVNAHSYHLIFKDIQTGIIEEEIKEQLCGKAESWNFLIGVTYTFKSKEKKNKEN